MDEKKTSPLQNAADGFKEAKLGLRSPDAPTRRMSVIFYVSLFGVAVTVFGTAQFFLARRSEKAARHAVAEKARIEAVAQEDERKKLLEPPPYQTMGTFSLELREDEGVARTSGLRAAEMEIVVACSDLSVCEWIKGHIDVSRGSLGSLFTPADREKILSPMGKKAFREEIREALNRLLEERGIKGTVTEVLFPRFILS